MTIQDSGLAEFTRTEISKGPEQPVVAPQPEPKITAQITAAAERAAAEINKLQVETRETLLKNEFENPPAPVNTQGILDHKFLTLIKQVVVWRDANKTIPDYERTRELRAIIYEGYERQKSSKPGAPPGPVSDADILAVIQKRIEKIKAPPEIAYNRFIHKES